MDDLISRQAAIKETWQEPIYTDPLNVLTEIRDRLYALPPIDAVEVVRCRECRYFNSTFPLLHMCDISWMKMEPDEYCSLGERKDD